MPQEVDTADDPVARNDFGHPFYRLLWLVRTEAHIAAEIRREGLRLHQAGNSWASIGKALGISRQAAWERFTR